MQALPWQGPIVIRRSRLRSSIESKPSVTAVFSSLFVTSMQRQANCLPWPAPTSGGRTTGSRSAAASARAARSVRRRRARRARAPSRLEPREPALRDRALERARAGDRARGVDVRGQLRRQERLRRLVERELGAGHREQVRRGARNPARTTRSQGIVRPPCSPGRPDHDLADAAASLGGHDRRARDDRRARRPVARRGRRSTTVTSAPAPRAARGGLVARSRSRSAPRRAPAREHAVAVHQQVDGGREHHAGQVVVREHRGLLDRAGREHQVPRPDPVEPVAVRGGDQRTAEHPERRRPRDDPSAPAASASAASSGDIDSRPRRAPRGRSSRRPRSPASAAAARPGRAGADHEDVRVEVVAPRAARGPRPSAPCRDRPSSG